MVGGPDRARQAARKRLARRLAAAVEERQRTWMEFAAVGHFLDGHHMEVAMKETHDRALAATAQFCRRAHPSSSWGMRGPVSVYGASGVRWVQQASVDAVPFLHKLMAEVAGLPDAPAVDTYRDVLAGLLEFLAANPEGVLIAACVDYDPVVPSLN